MTKRKFILLSALIFFLSAWLLLDNSSARAVQQPSWVVWVKQLREEAISRGIRPEVFDRAFSTVKEPSRKVMHLERTQPERRITFLKYRSTRADPFRIRIGRAKYQKHHRILTEIGNKYGVNPCFIVSLWGMETSYGSYMGNFPVIQSLATLAYESQRKAFFRKQLFYALEILNGGHVTLQNFKGEWAGASGQPQFLPSSWHNYAVDYDGDGRKDIWNDLPDAFASIANYLAKHGWKAHQPWAIEVILPSGFDTRLLNGKIKKTIQEWQRMGIRTVGGRPWPHGNEEAELIRPDGGPNFLVFNNFNVLMKWNRSTYYAGTVGWMAEQICGRPIQ
ncbi:lytic murein transglycosylase [Coxiella burnetii]|uniref:lytic murein transglycosylase n=1 Tax=Coxiella burnetii TaxID=777 RepID=UPI00222E2B23|nr:lytic murein transglycosylase [Coxiella burnetii]